MRTLLISGHTPFRTDFGGGQRSNLIHRVLRSIGEVDVLLVGPRNAPGRSQEETHGKAEGLLEFALPLTRGQRWPWRLIRPVAPERIDKLAYNVGRRVVDYQRNPTVGAVFDRLVEERRYDLVVGRCLKHPSLAGARAFTPSIFDLDDNDIELYRSIVADPSTGRLRRLILRSRVRTLERLVPRLVRECTCLWVAKEEDLSLPGFEKAAVLPNIPFTSPGSPPLMPLPADPASKIVMFVGMLNFTPNVHGVTYFLENVWPRVHQAVPEAVFRIVGSRISAESRQRWGAAAGVEVAGFVEDLREAYRRSAFTVVPIWQGSGTNIKVLESLAYGRTCVLSAVAHRGYGRTLRHGEAVLVGPSNAEMAEGCIKLLREPEWRQRLARTGGEIVARDYGFDHFSKVITESVEQVLSKNRRDIGVTGAMGHAHAIRG